MCEKNHFVPFYGTQNERRFGLGTPIGYTNVFHRCESAFFACLVQSETDFFAIFAMFRSRDDDEEGNFGHRLRVGVFFFTS